MSCCIGYCALAQKDGLVKVFYIGLNCGITLV